MLIAGLKSDRSKYVGEVEEVYNLQVKKPAARTYPNNLLGQPTAADHWNPIWTTYPTTTNNNMMRYYDREIDLLTVVIQLERSIYTTPRCVELRIHKNIGRGRSKVSVNTLVSKYKSDVSGSLAIA